MRGCKYGAIREEPESHWISKYSQFQSDLGSPGILLQVILVLLPSSPPPPAYLHLSPEKTILTNKTLYGFK